MIHYFSEVVSNNSKYFKKQSMKAKDKGWYKCLAINELGSEENLFPVQVYSRFYSDFS